VEILLLTARKNTAQQLSTRGFSRLLIFYALLEQQELLLYLNPAKLESKLTAKTKKKQRRLNLELRNSQR
jgi:hypothetical protein